MRNIKWFLCLALTMVTLVGLVGVIAAQGAETQGYSLAELLNNGQIKPLGRTVINDDSTGIQTEWSGTGFEMNVNADGGTFTVHYKSSYQSYWVILADGEQIWRGLGSAAPNGGSFSSMIPAGKYKLSVIKETQLSSSTSSYYELLDVTFAGTVEARPADKPLYIEFVGDSYSAGCGALGVYNPGAVWSSIDDSATNSFPYFTAQLLGADYSIVARGGIGLTGGDAQETVTTTINMQRIYNYTSGYRDMNSGKEYDFTAHPADIVVVHLGANDSTGNSTNLAVWKTNLSGFITQVRQKNPHAAIVFASHKPACYYAMTELIAERADTDPNLYTFHYSHQHNGSAAKGTQKDGHPSSKDHKAIAVALANFLQEKELVGKTQQPTPEYQDIVYYVSENGDDGNNGLTLQTAKNTLSAAMQRAKEDHTLPLPNGSRLVFQVQGTVIGSATQYFAVNDTFRTEDGKCAPILVTTYDYDRSGRALLRVTYTPKDSGSSSMYLCNNMTFQNITIRSEANNEKTFCASRLYAAGHALTFDNAILTTDGQAASYSRWSVYADHFIPRGLDLTANRIDSSVTFRNGDYTNLATVAAVGSNSLWQSSGVITQIPNLHCRIVVDKGARMGSVYGLVGTLQVGSATVAVNGGTVDGYHGTANGTSAARKTYSVGSLNFQISCGKVTDCFYGTGDYVSFNGSIHNTFSGGDIWVEVSSNTISMVLGGGKTGATVTGDVANTLSGGNLTTVSNSTNADCGIYFGGGNNSRIEGNLINNVSAGNISVICGKAIPSYSGIHLGSYSGGITGQLRNTISGGAFDTSASFKSGNYYFSGRGLDTPIGNGIVNILGVSGQPDIGPRFLGGGAILLGGGWGRLGATGSVSEMPADDYYNVNGSVSNTIYGGTFGGKVCCGINGTSKDVSGNYVAFVGGDITNKIYGGMFQSNFYGAGGTRVYGSVTTEIHGGIFCSIYGGSDAGTVNGNVKLTVTAMREYYETVTDKTQLGIYGGSNTGKILGNVEVHLKPVNWNDVSLCTALHRGSKTGSIGGSSTLTIWAGTFPNGLSVDQLALSDIVASGSTVCDSNGYPVALTPGQTQQPGPTTVRPEGSAALLLPHRVCGVENCTEHDEILFAPWEDGTALPSTSGHYYLTTDVALPKNATVGSALDITLCLHGHNVNLSSGIIVLSGNLTICDCTAAGEGDTYTAGSLSKGNRTATGGAIYADKGQLNFYSGIIENCETTKTGGAVSLNNAAIFNMYGGQIRNNTANDSGGAIFLTATSAFHMYGGMICGNTGKSGSAICLQSSAQATIRDSVITGNTGSAAVYMKSNANTLTLAGAAKIQNNEAGNILLPKGHPGVNASGLSAGARIGVTLAADRIAAGQMYITTELTEGVDPSAYVVSDDTAYEVTLEGAQLVLSKVTAVSHKHCVCSEKICTEHTQTEYQKWTKTDSLPTSGDYYLTADVTLTDQTILTKNSNLNLCLNGHTVTGSSTRRIFAAPYTGAVITISDCTAKTVDGVYTAGKLTGAYHNGTSGGGAIFIGTGSTLNLFDGVITDNGCHNNGGGVYIQGAMNMYGGQISDNKAYETKNGVTNWKNGGNIYVDGGGSFTMAGGMLSCTDAGNVLADKGGAIYMQAGSAVAINGGTIKNCAAISGGHGIYQPQGSVLTVGEAATGAYPYSTDRSGIVKVAGIKEGSLISDGDFNTIEWVDANTIRITRRDTFLVGGRPFSTLQDAVDAAAPGEVITLNIDLTDDITVNKGVLLDLNGKTLIGNITLTNGATFSGMDSATDRYTVSGQGKFIGEIIGGTLEKTSRDENTKKRYAAVSITDADGTYWTFNRFYIGMNSIAVHVGSGEVGYRATVGGNEHIQTALAKDAFGFEVWVGGYDDYKQTPTLAKSEFVTGSTGTAMTLTVKNQLKHINNLYVSGKTAEAETLQNKPVFAAATIHFADGASVRSAEYDFSIVQMYQALDSGFSSLTTEQKENLKSLVTKYPIMENWNLDNIAAYVPSASAQ